MIESYKTQIGRFFHEHAHLLLALVALQVAVYSYYYFGPIFTNHTFPNAWLVSYPSFKTHYEGRWLADLIIMLQGGSGVQSFQMFLATALQALNGVIFARLCGAEKPPHIALAAALLCLYPAFLDYYAFNIDHLTFVLGDTIALLGLMLALRRPMGPAALVQTGFIFMLTLACYQPKIALVSLLSLIFFIRKLESKEDSGVNSVIGTAAYTALLVTTACAFYIISLKLTASSSGGDRTYTNSPSEVWQQIELAYRVVFEFYVKGAYYLPPLLRAVPLVIVAAGLPVLFLRLNGSWYARSIALAVFLIALPLALRASYIINTNSWEHSGRLTFVYGYALIFHLIVLMNSKPLQRAGTLLTAGFVYFAAVASTHMSNAAAMKNEYDLAHINRIVQRLEAVAPPIGAGPYPVVVFGHYPEFPWNQYASIAWVHTATPMFETYRQPQILNFFLGKDMLRQPTSTELEAAIAAVKMRKPWPSPESVFFLDNSFVILLEPYSDDMPRTWTLQ